MKLNVLQFNQAAKTMEESEDEHMEGDHEDGPMHYEHKTDGSDESTDSLSALPDVSACDASIQKYCRNSR